MWRNISSFTILTPGPLSSLVVKHFNSWKSKKYQEGYEGIPPYLHIFEATIIVVVNNGSFAQFLHPCVQVQAFGTPGNVEVDTP